MKKLILGFILMCGVAYAQPVSGLKVIQDTTIQLRTDLNTNTNAISTLSDTTDSLRADLNTNTTAFASYLPLVGGTMTGNLTLNDDVKLKLGDSGADGQLFSDGTESFLQSLSKNLKINATGAYNIYLGTGATYDWQLDSDGNFFPTVNQTYDIGDATHEVDSIYAQDMYVSNDVLLEDAGQLKLGSDADMSLSHSGFAGSITNTVGHLTFLTGAYDIIFGTSTTNRWKITSTGLLIPNIDNTYDIGSSSYGVKNIYADSITLNGTDLQTTLDAKVTTASIGGQIADSIQAQVHYENFVILSPQATDPTIPLKVGDVTITGVEVIVIGGTSVTWNLEYGATVTAGVGTNVFTTAKTTSASTTYTSFDSPDNVTPAATYAIWLNITAVDGAVEVIDVVLKYTRD